MELETPERPGRVVRGFGPLPGLPPGSGPSLAPLMSACSLQTGAPGPQYGARAAGNDTTRPLSSVCSAARADWLNEWMVGECLALATVY